MTAPGGGATSPASPRASAGLPCPGQAANRDQHWGLGRDEAARQIEIALCLLPDRVASPGLFALHEQDMGADRRPNRQEQRQQAEAVESFIPCRREVAVEHLVCRHGLIEMDPDPSA